jgi:magnesium transporter
MSRMLPSHGSRSATATLRHLNAMLLSHVVRRGHRIFADGVWSQAAKATAGAGVPPATSSSEDEKGAADAAAVRSVLCPLPRKNALTMRDVCTTDGALRWTDVEASDGITAEEYHDALPQLLHTHGVHETLVEDIRESILLPQSVVIGSTACIVLRCFNPGRGGLDMRSLTTRLTIFVFPGHVLTVHRRPIAALTEIRKRLDAPNSKLRERMTTFHLVNLLFKAVVQSFHEEVLRCTVAFDDLEAQLFGAQHERAQLAPRMHAVKRRAAMCSRVLSMSDEAYAHAAAFLDVPVTNPYYQDVAQHLTHVKLLAEELSDNAHNVMQLLFQLSSFQLNELMRVLTLFSAFFIPLSFIAGLYGMNFESMPLLSHERGGEIAMCLMAAVATMLAAWFKFRGF